MLLKFTYIFSAENGKWHIKSSSFQESWDFISNSQALILGFIYY